MSGALVVDLTRLLPGAFCTQMLADHGARVIKVEEPGHGDYMREIPPLQGRMGAMFHAVNRNKESIAVDLRDARGRHVLERLLRTADVLVEGFRPGVMERLGLDPADLLDHHPRLVVCRLSGYGQTGPLRERPGHDLNYLALTGVQALLRGRDCRPALPGVQFGDLVGGMAASVGILMALRERDRTGHGQVVDTAMADALLGLLAMPAGMLGASGDQHADLFGPVGTPSYDVYETADGGWFSVACLEPHFWKNLCGVLGLDHLIDHQFGSPTEQEDTRRQVAEVFASRTRDEWEQLLAGEDVCVAPVLEVDEALDHPHARARGAVFDHGHVLDGPMTSVAAPTGLGGVGRATGVGAPLRGQHTRDVLAELGIAAEAVAELLGEGVLETEGA